jgi:single-strand DNA-binding protein
MNKVMLVGRLTRDPELRSLPSGKHVATFTVATNEFRGGNAERTEYHPCVAWDRLAEICGQFLSKGQLVDVEGRLQTRQWDDDAGKRHWKTEVVVASLEMLSGRSKKEYAREAQAVAEDGSSDAEASPAPSDVAQPTPLKRGKAADAARAVDDLETVVAM